MIYLGDFLRTGAGLDAYLDAHVITHFASFEICPRYLAPLYSWPYIVPTLRYAEMLREEFGPVSVSSGYRNLWHNAEEGGAENSLHLAFNALDLSCRRGNPGDWWSFMRDVGQAAVGGLGLYSTFIHIDTRSLMLGRPPASWRG